MKTTRKILTLLLAVAMLLVMAIPAFADVPTSGSITIKGTDAVPVTGKTFNAYKILDLSISENSSEEYNYAYTVPSKLKTFYEGIVKNDGNTTDTLDVRVQNYIGKLNGDALFAFAKQALAAAKVAGITPATKTVENSETSALIDKLDLGYYVIEDDTATATDSVVSALMLDTAMPNVEITIKADTNSIDKFIVEENRDKNGTSANVGDTVNFKTTTAVPDTTGYTSYTYKIYDTMSAGLTFNPATANLTVTVGGTTVAAGAATWSVDYTVPGKTFVITFDSSYIINATEGQPIVVTYTATLDSGALITDKETNTTYLEYSNNPQNADTEDETTTETPEKTVYVYDFDIVIDKYVSGKTSSKLANAKFKLYKTVEGTNYYYAVDATTKAVTWKTDKADGTEVTTDDDGYAIFKGLEAGTYYLEETAAPAGYNMLSGPVTVTITADYNNDGTYP